MPQLTEIAEVEIGGRKLKLGKNGKVCLVEEKTDAWGNTYGVEIDLSTFVFGDSLGDWSIESKGRVQAILDLLGDALSRLRQQRDSRLQVQQREEKG